MSSWLSHDFRQTSAQRQHPTEDVHCPSIQNNPPSPTRLPSTSMTLLSTWHTICLLVYLCLFSLMRRSTPSRQGLSQFCSLLHLQLLEQCLTQNKCSINNVCFLNERMKVTFHKRLHSIKISANAPGECLFPSFLPRLDAGIKKNHTYLDFVVWHHIPMFICLITREPEYFGFLYRFMNQVCSPSHF